MKKFSPVTPLTRFYTQELGVSVATGKKLEKLDPDFPHDEIVQVGVNRRGITERGKQRYQAKLVERAKQPRAISPNLANPKVAAARSVEVRRAKAISRRAREAIAQ